VGGESTVLHPSGIRLAKIVKIGQCLTKYKTAAGGRNHRQ